MAEAENEAPRLRARLMVERAEYIHNDLANAAYHLVERIEAKIKNKDMAGITLDAMAAAVMTAFSFEAYLNFLGARCVTGWKERQSFATKLKVVTSTLGVVWDAQTAPYQTVEQLFNLRNELGHGKPAFVVRQEVVEGTHAELDAALQPPVPEWQKVLTPEFALSAYSAVKAVWKELIKAAGLDLWDTTSHGSGGLEFIGFVGTEVDLPTR